MLLLVNTLFIQITNTLSTIYFSDIMAELENEYTNVEKVLVNHGGGWKPPMQEDMVDAERGRSLSSTNMPTVLPILMKCFAHSGDNVSPGSKICNPVDIPKVSKRLVVVYHQICVFSFSLNLNHTVDIELQRYLYRYSR